MNSDTRVEDLNCFTKLAGLTVPAVLFGSLMMSVPIVLLLPSAPLSIWMPLSAAAPRSPALLVAQVKEELMGGLLSR